MANPFESVLSKPKEEETFVAPPPNTQTPPIEGSNVPQFGIEPTNMQTPGLFGGTSFNNPTPSQQTMRYPIIDMLWFINQKMVQLDNSKKSKFGSMLQGECHFLSIGYNAAFSNLRLTFYNLNSNSVTKSSIILGSATKLANCNLHSETCAELLSKRETGVMIDSYERVIKVGNNWTPNITKLIWSNNLIAIQTITSNNQSVIFSILDWQIPSFESALNFMINGQAWLASLSSVIMRGQDE